MIAFVERLSVFRKLSLSLTSFLVTGIIIYVLYPALGPVSGGVIAAPVIITSTPWHKYTLGYVQNIKTLLD